MAPGAGDAAGSGPWCGCTLNLLRGRLVTDMSAPIAAGGASGNRRPSGDSNDDAPLLEAAVAAADAAQPGGRPSLSLHDCLKKPAGECVSPHEEKRCFQPYHAQSVPKSENLEGLANDRNGKPITTVMLRNIPNKYTQNTLLQEINDAGFTGTYNFFYLPMDTHNRSNVGYAFINLKRPRDAERFRRVFSDHRFERFHSRKIGSVCVAHVQGLDENLRHFENRAVTQARNDQYRPIVLEGNVRVDFEAAVVAAKERLAAREAQAPAAVEEGEDPMPGEAHGEMPGPGGVSEARQNLEAAIRDFLTATGTAGQAALVDGKVSGDTPGKETKPYSEFSGYSSFSKPPMLRQDIGTTEGNGFGYDTLRGEDDDIAQLLSLRSMLQGLLQGKQQACGATPISALPGLGPPPGFEAPGLTVGGDQRLFSPPFGLPTAQGGLCAM